MRPAPTAASCVLLAAAVLLSLALGARHLSVGEVWAGLTDPNAAGYAVVHDMRLPRTVLGLLVGLALGVAGAVMQAVTRNPLADPGLLGINAGASAAAVSAMVFFDVRVFTGYVGSPSPEPPSSRSSSTPSAAAEAPRPRDSRWPAPALNAALYSYVQAVMLIDPAALNAARFWGNGTLASADMDTARKVALFIAAGLLLALLLARPLNALALGDDAALALGARPVRTRAGAIVAVTLLCGAATAACGPLVFVGLIMPHAVRAVTGPDLRKVLPYCAILTPAALLMADVLGRLAARPSEIQVGIVCSVVGGALFLVLLRRVKAVAA
ncbi:FecCD family ABC transporter permease [Yinghuangia aomiensis]